MHPQATLLRWAHQAVPRANVLKINGHSPTQQLSIMIPDNPSSSRLVLYDNGVLLGSGSCRCSYVGLPSHTASV